MHGYRLNTTHQLAFEVGTKVVSHRDYLVRRWPTSAVKNVLAALRISLACSSSWGRDVVLASRYVSYPPAEIMTGLWLEGTAQDSIA